MATIYTSKSGFNANYVFTISGVTVVPVFGATYTNNSQTFTVVGANTSGTPGSISGYLFCTAGGAPTASGTLTKTGGTGDATITFSAYQTSGASYTASFLTIQAGITAAGSGGTVIVGSGLYNEKLTFATSATLFCDGIVVLDGTGIASNPAIYSSFIGVNIIISPYTSGGQFVVQNHVATNLIYSTSYAATVNITNAILISSSNTTCFNGELATSSSSFINVVFSGFTTCITAIFYNPQPLNLLNCTFYNGTNGIVTGSGSGAININNCIFSNFTTAWNCASAPTSNNNLYYTITNWKVGASTYTSLAQVQVAGYDLLSQVANPNFVDTANNCFYLCFHNHLTNILSFK